MLYSLFDFVVRSLRGLWALGIVARKMMFLIRSGSRQSCVASEMIQIHCSYSQAETFSCGQDGEWDRMRWEDEDVHEDNAAPSGRESEMESSRL